MNRVVKILMDRDGLTEAQARGAVEACKAELYEAIEGTSCLDPDEVIECELGLEPDYLDDILFG